MLENIKKLRAREKISQQELADIVGVSQQSVNKYENHNVEPGIDTLIKIADYFNVSTDFLIGRTDNERMAECVSGSRMSNRERKVIDSFRKLSETEQNSIELVMHNYLNKK